VSRAVPTDEELAAIVAAVELMWPQQVVEEEPRGPRRQTPWQTSSRWWSPPVAARRHRPRPGRWG
jgi:hypothetical protein